MSDLTKEKEAIKVSLAKMGNLLLTMKLKSPSISEVEREAINELIAERARKGDTASNNPFAGLTDAEKATKEAELKKHAVLEYANKANDLTALVEKLTDEVKTAKPAIGGNLETASVQAGAFAESVKTLKKEYAKLKVLAKRAEKTDVEFISEFKNLEGVGALVKDYAKEVKLIVKNSKGGASVRTVDVVLKEIDDTIKKLKSAIKNPPEDLSGRRVVYEDFATKDVVRGIVTGMDIDVRSGDWMVRVKSERGVKGSKRYGAVMLAEDLEGVDINAFLGETDSAPEPTAEEVLG